MSKQVGKILSVVLAVLMLVSVVPLTASAAVFEGTCGADGDNLTWKIDESTATLYINGTGDMKDFSYIGAAPWDQYYNRFIYVSIGDEVSSIGDYAFAHNKLYVDEIELGKGIKEIGNKVFNLDKQTITINKDNPYLYIDENGYVLSKDNTTLYAVLCEANSISVPDGVVEIKAFAFCYYALNEECKIYIPASVQSIDLDNTFISQPAFYVDENNQYFSSDEYGALFNKSKTIIYRGSAAVVNSYPRYKIPETVTEIADYAFCSIDYDSYLDITPSIDIAKNVKRIGKSVFCSSMEDWLYLFIPSTVEYLDPYFCVLGDTTAYGIYFEGTQEQWEQLYLPSAEYEECWPTVYYEHTTHILKDSELGACRTMSRCIVCGFIAESNTEHDWGEYENTKNATCTQDGTEQRVCTVCNATETETVNKLGHNFANTFTVDKKATCTNAGSKSKHCTRCDETSEVTSIPATGHKWSEWNVTKPATAHTEGKEERACTVCKTKEKRNIAKLPQIEVKESAKIKTSTVAKDSVFAVSGQSVADLKKSISADVKVLDKNSKAVADKAKLATGFQIVLSDSNGKVFDTVTVIVPGDVDGDGDVKAADARRALRAAVNLDSLESYEKSAADLDKPTKKQQINSADARYVLRAAVGLESTEKWLKDLK